MRKSPFQCVMFMRFAAAVGVAGPAMSGPASAQAVDGRGWVSAWTTSIQDPLPAGFALGNPAATSAEWGRMFKDNAAANQTFRFIVRPLAAGDQVRLKFSNAAGSKPVTFTEMRIATRAAGKQVNSVTTKPITFAGKNSITIAPGREVFSDVLDFAIAPEKDIAVTFHLPGDSGAITWHAKALVTSYMNGVGDGDAAADESGAKLPFEIRSWLWLTEIQAFKADSADRTTIVAIGDSITDGSASTIDGHDRWPDRLNKRLRAAGSQNIVVNAGIGGNRIAALRWGPVVYGAVATNDQIADQSGALKTPNARCEACGEPAIARLERDVLSLPNVSAVILFEGVNDLGAGASFGDVIAGMQDIILRARARGLKVYGGTITPYYGFAYDVATPDLTRRQINDWIRTSKAFDAVFDFDAVVRDPDYRARLKSEFAAADRIHPNPKGYAAIAESVPLSLLDNRLLK